MHENQTSNIAEKISKTYQNLGRACSVCMKKVARLNSTAFFFT
jgi:hypothetical protein